MAVGLVALSVLVIVLYPPFLQRGAFVLFLCAVAISSWYGGARAAIVATILTSMVAAYILFEPYGTLRVTEFEDVVRLVLFIIVASAISTLYEARARTERALQATHNRLVVALEHAQMGVWEVDLKSGELWWSSNLLQIYGQPESSFARTFESLIGYIHPDDQDLIRNSITRTTNGGTEFEIDHRIVHPDQRVCWIKTRGRIIRDARGKATKVLASAIEIPMVRPAFLDQHHGSDVPSIQTVA